MIVLCSNRTFAQAARLIRYFLSECTFLRTDALSRGARIARRPRVAVGAQTRRLPWYRDQEPSRAHLASRNGKNFSERFPTITRALDRLPDETVVDGEIVATGEDGVPSFNLLQNFGGAQHTIMFYAFDLLILSGTDLRSRPLEQRRALLHELRRAPF